MEPDREMEMTGQRYRSRPGDVFWLFCWNGRGIRFGLPALPRRMSQHDDRDAGRGEHRRVAQREPPSKPQERRGLEQRSAIPCDAALPVAQRLGECFGCRQSKAGNGLSGALYTRRGYRQPCVPESASFAPDRRDCIATIRARHPGGR